MEKRKWIALRDPTVALHTHTQLSLVLLSTLHSFSRKVFIIESRLLWFTSFMAVKLVVTGFDLAQQEVLMLPWLSRILSSELFQSSQMRDWLSNAETENLLCKNLGLIYKKLQLMKDLQSKVAYIKNKNSWFTRMTFLGFENCCRSQLKDILNTLNWQDQFVEYPRRFTSLNLVEWPY